jgi:hypothetical protein
MMGVEFEKREDAEWEAEKINKNFEPEWFCPLIKGQCRKDCVSYEESVVTQAAGTWWAHQPSCNSPLVTGYVEVFTL